MSSMTLLRVFSIPMLGLVSACSSTPPVSKDPVTWVCTIKWNSNAPESMKEITKAMAKARSKKEAEDQVMARGEPGQKDKVECIGGL